MSDLEQLLEAWEKIADWKDATGLTSGGDPSNIEPDDLRAFLAKAARLERAAKAWLTAQSTFGWVISTEAERELAAAVLAMPPEDA